nr:hypothetical protein [Telluria mixta]
MPAPMVRRDARCVRSGAKLPCAGVPAIAWQRAQFAFRNTSRPRRAGASAGSGAGRRWFAAQVSYWSDGTACTNSAISACSRPQNSAHCPR